MADKKKVTTNESTATVDAETSTGKTSKKSSESTAKKTASSESADREVKSSKTHKHTDHIQEELPFAPIVTDYKVELIAQDKLKYNFKVTIGGKYLDAILEDFVKTQAAKEQPKIAGFGKNIPTRILVDHFAGKFKKGVYQTTTNMFDYILVTEVRRAVEYIKKHFELGATLDAEYISIPGRADAGQERASYQYTDYTYTFSVEKMPQVPQVELSKLKVKSPKGTVTDVDVDGEMARWAKSNTRGKDLAEPRPIKTGDTVEIKLSIPGKQETLDRFKVIVGEGKLNPDCEEQLLGKNVGDKFTYNFSLPKQFADPSLAGRSYNIEVQVQSIQETASYEIDEDMARHFGCASVKECQTLFRKQAEKTVGEQEIFAQKIHMRKALADAFEMEMPEQIVSKAMLQRHDRLAKEINMNLHYPVTDQEREALSVIMPEKFGYDYDTWLKHEQAAMHSDAKADLALREFAKANKISVSNTEIDQVIASRAGQFKKGLKEAVAYYEQNPQAVQQIYQELLDDKTAKAALAQVQLQEEVMSYEQLRQHVWVDSRANVLLEDKSRHSAKTAQKTKSTKAKE